MRRPKNLISPELIQSFQLRRNDIGLVFFAGHVMTLLATGTLVNQTEGSGWWYFALFLHGVFIVHLFAPFHEATHKTAFASQKLNTLIAGFSGLMIMIPPQYFTMEHAAHHTYTQNPEKMVAKSPKIPKNAKKVDFLRGRFFDDFLDGQKIEKRRHSHHRLISSPGPGLHWGTIGGTINQQNQELII